MNPNDITREIIGAAIEVHRELGPGKPEAVYEAALSLELGLRGLPHRVQVPVPVVYKGIKLECGYRVDILAAGAVVVEIKSVESLHPIHRAQGLTYLKLGGWRVALLFNFNAATLKEGIERLVLGLEEATGEPTVAKALHGSKGQEAIRTPVFRSEKDSGDEAAERLVREVIACALEVHRELGPGLLPSAYGACLCHELHLRGISFERRQCLKLNYKGTALPESDEVELLVGGRVAVSPQAGEAILPVSRAALLSQLRLGGWSLGLLINFNTVCLAEGLQRVVFSAVGRASTKARV